MAVNFVPTRLLDLSCDGLVSVISRKHLHLPTKYAALSYCWGEGNHTKLLKGNIETFKRGVGIETLPQTLKDTVQITKALGLQYLWIDALCIIQDDREDWLREAPLMHGVYLGCYLNISATASADTSQGLFRTRPRWWCTPGFTYLGDDPHGIMFSSSRWNPVRHGPLNGRAWTLQERILSPRILHFCETEIFWECHSLRASESSPRGIFQNWTNAERFFDVTSFNSPRNLDDWLELVRNYANRKLTIPEDRLMAISSVARLFMDNCGLKEDDYIVGIWRPHFSRNLLWFRPAPDATPWSTASPIPSWSWASSSGGAAPIGTDLLGLLARESYISLDLFKLLAIERKRNENPFGPTPFASLRLHCFLLPFEVHLAKTQSQQSIDIGRYQRTGSCRIPHDTTIFIGQTKAKGFPDRPWKADSVYYFVPISLCCINYPWQRQLDIALEGLVLEQVDAERALFVRAGVAQISERNYNYSDLEHILAELKIIDGSGMPERKDHEEILSTANLEPYRRSKEYFTSPVFTLTSGRVEGELQRKIDVSTQ